MKLNRNIKIFINYFLGPLLFIWLAWSIYKEIKHQPDLSIAWQHIRESFGGPMIWNLAAVIVLMLVNWSVEALKWKMAVQQVQTVSFGKAFKAVLSGVSFSVSTPNRVGEYLGRVMYMDEGNRLKTISITIVSSMSQLIITLLMGSIGLVILRPAIEEGHLISSIWMKVILYGVLAALSVLTLFYFKLSWLIKWIDRLPGSQRFAYLIRALEDFNATLLIRLLSLSLFRFIVFIIQYYLLFRLFNVEISWWQSFWAVSVSFLVLAAIPSFAILELMQRGYVTKTIVGLYSTNIAGIGLTTAGIWLINLIIPAIIGSLLILGIKKIYSGKNEKT
jgi:uncharacterized membrane protein YbhN (UPF0104 family)